MLALGKTSRTRLAAHMKGLPLLFAFIRKTPDSECYLHGAARMKRELLKMHIVAAVASGPTEEVLAMLFENDRFLLQVKMISFTTEQEFEFVWDVSDDVYTYLASFVGSGAMKVRSDVLSVLHASVCFLLMRVLENEGDTVVDLEHKLDELGVLEAKPQEELAGQMWACIKFNLLPRNQLLRLPGQGRGTGQAHASAAQTKKYHPHFGHDNLRFKAALHMAKSLTQSAADACAMQRKQRVVEEFRRRTVRDMTGRQFYLKCAFDGVGETFVGIHVDKITMRKNMFAANGDGPRKTCAT